MQFAAHQEDNTKATEQVKNEQLRGQLRTKLAALRDRTQYRPTIDCVRMRWVMRPAARIPCCRAMGGSHRGQLRDFGNAALAHHPEVGEELGDPAPQLADRWTSALFWRRATVTTSTKSELVMEW